MAVTAATPAVRVRARRTRNSARYEHNVKQRVVVTARPKTVTRTAEEDKTLKKTFPQINTVLLDC